MLAGQGDRLPVSAFPADGTWPTGTAQWEKRSIADEIPVWDPRLCIHCAKCAMVCPHAAIRMKVFEPDGSPTAPDGIQASRAFQGSARHSSYTIQVAPEDCTGCGCASTSARRTTRPTRADRRSMMVPQPPHARRRTRQLRLLPRPSRSSTARRSNRLVKGSQLLQPLFEFSGACAGCGETPYLKLLTQLFGDRHRDRQRDRLLVDLRRQPARPRRTRTNRDGRGPAWANSLFEDNAEFGLGFVSRSISTPRRARRRSSRAARARSTTLLEPTARRGGDRSGRKRACAPS